MWIGKKDAVRRGEKESRIIYSALGRERRALHTWTHSIQPCCQAGRRSKLREVTWLTSPLTRESPQNDVENLERTDTPALLWSIKHMPVKGVRFISFLNTRTRWTVTLRAETLAGSVLQPVCVFRPCWVPVWGHPSSVSRDPVTVSYPLLQVGFDKWWREE